MELERGGGGMFEAFVGGGGGGVNAFLYGGVGHVQRLPSSMAAGLTLSTSFPHGRSLNYFLLPRISRSLVALGRKFRAHGLRSGLGGSDTCGDGALGFQTS